MRETHKAQHTIPKSYLAAWLEPSTPRGQTPAILKISKTSKEVRRRSPTNCFNQTDRYTIRLQDGARDLTVEHKLGGIEGVFRGVLNTVRLKKALTPLEKAKLCAFTAAMIGRSKQQGDFLLKQELQHLELVKELERTHNIEPKASREIEVFLKNHHAHLVTMTIESIAPILFGMHLTICTTDDPLGFITSDAPAVINNPDVHEREIFHGQAGLAQRNVEVTLPLTPGHLALFTHKRGDSFYVPLPTSFADEANRTTYFFCQDEFVSRTGEMKSVWFNVHERPFEHFWNTGIEGTGV